MYFRRRSVEDGPENLGLALGLFGGIVVAAVDEDGLRQAGLLQQVFGLGDMWRGS